MTNYQRGHRFPEHADLPHPVADLQPLSIDPWVASSLLHKAIRRGDVETAQRAALTLFRHRGAGIWRRLLVIVFEDVGAGCPRTVCTAVLACTDPAWRKDMGGDEATILSLTRRLAEAPKERSADFLMSGFTSHPSLDGFCERMGTATLAEQLTFMSDDQVPLPLRAVATCYAAGIRKGDATGFRRGGLSHVMERFKALGVPDDLVDATSLAAALTREPITVLVPLIWNVAHHAAQVIESPVPATAVVTGLPLYALVPADKHREAVWMAAFYADAAPVSRRLVWSESLALEELGRVSDMLRVGVPQEGVAPLIEAVSDHLDHLNAVRGRCLLGEGLSMASRFDGHSSYRWVARVWQGQFAAIPAPFTWEDSVAFAHLINGYEVMGSVERLFTLYRRTTTAARTRRLDHVSAIDAWLTLFAAHRGYRHQGYGPNQDEEHILDQICEHL